MSNKRKEQIKDTIKDAAGFLLFSVIHAWIVATAFLWFIGG